MIVYFLVFLWVVVIAGIAEQLDFKSIENDSKESITLTVKSVTHTSAACFAYILVSIGLVLIAGLRYYVGADYGGYYLRWSKYAEELGYSILRLDEPGYRLICAFFKFVGIIDGAYPIFVTSVLTIGLALFVVYRNSYKLWLASILFYLIYWTSGFNAVRQCLAATFVFCGYESLRDRKICKYLIWVGIAFLFHRSAICMIFPYFFIHSKISYINMLLIVLGCIIFLQSYDFVFDLTEVILDKEFNFENLEGYSFRKVNRLRIFFNCVPAGLFFIWEMTRRKTISYNQTFWMNILLFKAAISLAAMNSPYLSRMGIYFSPFMILAYCGLIKEIPVEQRKVLAFGLCILYSIFTFYEIYHSSSLRYFQFIWQR